MRNFHQVLIAPDTPIRKALEIIDKGAMKIAIVVDNEHTLLGTLSDGDVRRALLRGISLEEPINDVYFRTPVTCSVDQTKEEVLQVALAKGLFQIPIVDSRGKVAAIMEISELIRPSYHSNKVILMVGGLGTRLQPLTNSTPKPMLKVGNKPILETIIQNIAKNGYKDIILCGSEKSRIIEEYFGNGSSFGVTLEYIYEEKRLGTAGALGLIKQEIKQPFFVMNGDLLTNINFKQMHDFHVTHKAFATMAVREYDFQVPYGVVTQHDSEIVSIEEKPRFRYFVSAGIYMLVPEVLSFISDNSYFDMPNLFDRLISEKKRAVSFPIHEYWLDIGRVDDYERANNEYHEVFL